jgi:uncharacterized protein (TIGR00730 family)
MKDEQTSPQLQSRSYRLAALDPDFLLGDSMRGVRFLLEFSKADEILRNASVRSTLVVFGSARVREHGPAHEANWYAQARRFGRIASERGGALNAKVQVRDNVIATGGGPGIMAAANRGAADCGAISVGFNITLPREQLPNAWSTPELSFRFHYFAMRKMHLAMRANALVVFPGGFGTIDELFEILALRQTDKASRIPIVLADLDLFGFADDAEGIWAELLARGLKPHSSIELSAEQDKP